MEEKSTTHEELVQLARLALAGRSQDVQLHIRRMAKRLRKSDSEAADRLTALLREQPTRSSPLRKSSVGAVPVDLDTRMQLLRVESPVHLPVEPIYDALVWESLRQVVDERRALDRLERHGLSPTRTMLLTGAPGVGKTLAAKWIAHELELPLLILDLSSVMSSFLGRTGNNVRYVLDYAKGLECVLLLDELDAIAKRRDDATEVGELKRLVTVLLQEIDDWPPSGLLLAATNHSDLLDPAVWRRFEMAVEFPMPGAEAVSQAVHRFLGGVCVDDEWIAAISASLRGLSFSDIERFILRSRRAAVLTNDIEEHMANVVRDRVDAMSREDRIDLATTLVNSRALSQRRAQELTGVSRDTIRKHAQANGRGR